MSAAARALAEAHIEFAAEPVARASTLSLTELRGDEQSAAGVLAAASDSAALEEEDEESSAAGSLSGSAHGTFGSFSGGAALGGGRAASTETFGARLDGSLDASASQASQPRGNNWMLIAACVVVFLGASSAACFISGRFPSRRRQLAAAKSNRRPCRSNWHFNRLRTRRNSRCRATV